MGKIFVNLKGYICCPCCGNPTKTKVTPKTKMVDFPLYCPWCKKEYIINFSGSHEPVQS